MNPLETSNGLLQAAGNRGRPQQTLKWTILKGAEKMQQNMKQGYMVGEQKTDEDPAHVPYVPNEMKGYTTIIGMRRGYTLR